MIAFTKVAGKRSARAVARRAEHELGRLLREGLESGEGVVAGGAYWAAKRKRAARPPR